MKDLIRRSDAIKDLCDISNNSDMPEDWHRGLSVAVSALYRVSSADRPQGEWILECDGEGECDNLYRCSECGCEYGCQEYDIPNFCPNCGAKMKGADDE